MANYELKGVCVVSLFKNFPIVFALLGAIIGIFTFFIFPTLEIPRQAFPRVEIFRVVRVFRGSIFSKVWKFANIRGYVFSNVRKPTFSFYRR